MAPKPYERIGSGGFYFASTGSSAKPNEGMSDRAETVALAWYDLEKTIIDWVPEGSLAGFVGCILKSGRPWGAGKTFKMVGGEAPTFLKAFPGPRGRPDIKNATPKNPARLPSSTQKKTIIDNRSAYDLEPDRRSC